MLLTMPVGLYVGQTETLATETRRELSADRVAGSLCILR